MSEGASPPSPVRPSQGKGKGKGKGGDGFVETFDVIIRNCAEGITDEVIKDRRPLRQPRGPIPGGGGFVQPAFPSHISHFALQSHFPLFFQHRFCAFVFRGIKT